MTSLNVLPDPACGDRADTRNAQSVGIGEAFQWPAGFCTQTADLQHVRSSEFRLCASSAHHVAGVLGEGAGYKVSRLYAGWCIARVSDELIATQWSDEELVGDATRADSLIFPPEDSVTTGLIQIALPQPTSHRRRTPRRGTTRHVVLERPTQSQPVPSVTPVRRPVSTPSLVVRSAPPPAVHDRRTTLNAAHSPHSRLLMTRWCV